MSESILRRRIFGWLADWFERVLPPRPRNVLAWSWWGFKHLYRGGYVVAAFLFCCLWLASYVLYGLARTGRPAGVR